MQRSRLKQLITDLEDLLAEIKSEVYADPSAYIDSDGEQWYSGDDDDGYADWKLALLEQVTQEFLQHFITHGMVERKTLR